MRCGIRLTTTQAQRLRELGADPTRARRPSPTPRARDAAFKQLEDELVRAGRRRLQELRAGRRAPQLVELESVLSDGAHRAPGSSRS